MTEKIRIKDIAVRAGVSRKAKPTGVTAPLLSPVETWSGVKRGKPFCAVRTGPLSAEDCLPGMRGLHGMPADGTRPAASG